MPVEILWFALVGAVVGAAARTLLRNYFPAARSLTVSTGTVAALFGGVVARAVLGSGNTALCTAAAGLTAAVLVSVLARPDRASRRAQRGMHRTPA